MKMSPKYAAPYLLAAINFSCAALHAVFQFDLLGNTGKYREFLLTENLVIAFIFAYFAAIIFWGKAADKQMMAKMNILFWFVFLLFVGCTQPAVTSLDIVKSFLIFPQNYYLLFFGCVSLLLSLLSYQQLKYRRSND